MLNKILCLLVAFCMGQAVAAQENNEARQLLDRVADTFRQAGGVEIAFEVRAPQCVIGRERASSDVTLKDPNVSRRHAQVICAGGAWSIEDLNSTNGTLVNNRRVTRCPLRDGDLLTFGLSTFEFRG